MICDYKDKLNARKVLTILATYPANLDEIEQLQNLLEFFL